MKIRFSFLALILLATGVTAQDQLKIKSIPVPASIRALSVINAQEIWFAGSHGTFGHSQDAGATWTIDSLAAPDGTYPEFRALSVTPGAVFLLSVASPALLYRSRDRGESWELVYQDDNPAIFYDAMDFRDDDFGAAVGDPVNGCLSVLITRDGGDSWSVVPCSVMPPAQDGEGCFAASNSNIQIRDKDIWLASGGPVARVYHSRDEGKSWTYANTPMVQGGKMTGIFSLAFLNRKKGIIIGGDWEKMELNTGNKAITTDGGQSWQLVSDGSGPGYRSSVRYVPGTRGKVLYAVGIPGISSSRDGGHTWQSVSTEGFYIIRFTPDGRRAWVAGQGKVGTFQVTD